MILQLENWHLGYSQILKDCREKDGSVWILCNSDADALAAARILCYMLRSDGVNYQIRPCNNYSAMETLLINNNDNACCMVLLNLGASKNLTQLVVANDNVRIFVMDCRRPFHLANVHAGQNVVLFWDQNQLEEIPSDGDNLSGTESTTSEEDSSSEDDESSLEEEFQDEDQVEEEQEFDYQVQAKVSPTTKASSLEGDKDYDGEDDDDNNDDEPRGSPSKRQKTSQERSMSGSEGVDIPKENESILSLQERRRERRERLRVLLFGRIVLWCPCILCGLSYCKTASLWRTR